MARAVDDLLASIDDVLGQDDGGPVPTHWEVGYQHEDAMTWSAEPSQEEPWLDRHRWARCEVQPAIASATLSWSSGASDPAADIRRWISLYSRQPLALTAEQVDLLRQSYRATMQGLGLASTAPIPPPRRVDTARQQRIATAMRRVKRRAARRAPCPARPSGLEVRLIHLGADGCLVELTDTAGRRHYGFDPGTHQAR